MSDPTKPLPSPDSPDLRGEWVLLPRDEVYRLANCPLDEVMARVAEHDRMPDYVCLPHPEAAASAGLRAALVPEGAIVVTGPGQTERSRIDGRWVLVVTADAQGDPEIEAATVIIQAMDILVPVARARLAMWMLDRFCPNDDDPPAEPGTFGVVR